MHTLKLKIRFGPDNVTLRGSWGALREVLGVLQNNPCSLLEMGELKFFCLYIRLVIAQEA